MPRAHHGFAHLARDFYTVLQFGAGGAVSITGLPAFTGGAWTVAAWVNVANLAGVQQLLSSATPGAPQISIGTDGRLTLSAVGGATAGTSVGVVPARTWVHVAVRYEPDTGATRFYIDGEDAGASGTAVAFAEPATETVSLSTRSLVARWGLWRSALSQAEIRAEFYSWTGPRAAAMFRFADAVGAVGADSEGAASAALTSCAFAAHDAPTGPVMMPRQGGAVRLSAATDFVSCASGQSNLMLNGATRIVLAGWARLSSSGSNLITARAGTVQASLAVSAETMTGTFRSQAADSAQPLSTNHVNQTLPRTWRLNATELDLASGRIRNYLNGVLIGQQQMTFGSTVGVYAAAQDFRIGQDSNGSAASIGLIGPQYVLVGNVTRDMIRRLYVTGEIPNVDRVAYWLMDDRQGSAVRQYGNAPQNFNAALAGGAAWTLEAPWA